MTEFNLAFSYHTACPHPAMQYCETVFIALLGYVFLFLCVCLCS